MSKNKKWSEQCLVESTFTTQDETGNKVENKKVCFELCTDGLELYRQNFMRDTDIRKVLFSIPFDFFVLSGSICPRGDFYELEYFIGERGMVYRALLQVVNPVTDIPFVLGVLRSRNLLPKDFNPIKARRTDIGSLYVCSCSKDQAGKPSLHGHEKKPDAKAFDGLSIVEQYDNIGKCDAMSFDYYRGELREVYVIEDYECREKPVYVCGSENMTDPAFAQQREEALEEMNDLLEQVSDIADDCGVNMLIAFTLEHNGEVQFNITASDDVLRKLVADESMINLVSSLVKKPLAETAGTKTDDREPADQNGGHQPAKVKGIEKSQQDVEEYIIGAFLVDGVNIPDELFFKLAGMLGNRSFSDKRLHHIANAICYLWRKREYIDVLTVIEWLDNYKSLEDAGGVSYIDSLARDIASTSHLAQRMAILSNKSNVNE